MGYIRMELRGNAYGKAELERAAAPAGVTHQELEAFRNEIKQIWSIDSGCCCCGNRTEIHRNMEAFLSAWSNENRTAKFHFGAMSHGRARHGHMHINYDYITIETTGAVTPVFPPTAVYAPNRVGMY